MRISDWSSAVCPSDLGHRLLRSGPVSVKELAEEALIVLSVDEVEEVTGRYWRQAGVRPRVAFRTRSVEAVRSLVATGAGLAVLPDLRSEEHTSELQSLMRISYAVFCLTKNKQHTFT